MVENAEVLLTELFLILSLGYTLALIGRAMMISLITSVGEYKCIPLMCDKQRAPSSRYASVPGQIKAFFGVGCQIYVTKTVPLIDFSIRYCDP